MRVTPLLVVCAGGLALLAACRRDGASRAGPSAAARRLEGAWEADFALDAPPLGFDGAAARRVPHGTVHALLAFVPNAWLDAQAAETGAGATAPAAYGTFAADFGPFGIEPREPGRVPTVLVAGTSDSVILVLEPGNEQTSLYVAGAWRADSVVGTWRARSSGRGGATAGGGFVMRPSPPARAGARPAQRRPAAR